MVRNRTSLERKSSSPPQQRSRKPRRLKNLVRKLRNQGTIERYNQVIQDQIEEEIVERVPGPATACHEFYIPHKGVMRESAETTKLRVVYDASARAHSGAPSLNECLNPGPPLQNQLWSVLVRARFHPVAIAEDIKQAFLQVRIREGDRDALRFHWLKDLGSLGPCLVSPARHFSLGESYSISWKAAKQTTQRSLEKSRKASMKMILLVEALLVKRQKESNQHPWRYLLKAHSSYTSGTRT